MCKCSAGCSIALHPNGSPEAVKEFLKKSGEDISYHCGGHRYRVEAIATRVEAITTRVAEIAIKVKT